MNWEQLRKQVFGLETTTPELKEEFETALRQILLSPLKPWERAAAVALVPFGFLLTGFCALSLLMKPDVFSTLIQAQVVLAALVGMLLAGWALRVLRTGRHLRNRLLFPSVAFGLFVAMIVISIALTGSVEQDLLAATMLIGFVFVWERVEVAELRIRETALRQELQLIELTDCVAELRDEKHVSGDLNQTDRQCEPQ